MATEVVMPKLGMSMKEGVVTTWYKHAGDAIKKGDVIASINSEKIEMEIEAPADGELLKITVAENQGVPPGTVICFIGKSSELIEGSTPPDAVQHGKKDGKLIAPKEISATNENLKNTKAIKITPVAKKMAQAAGIDINKIVGNGPLGRITKEDVERVLNKEAAIVSSANKNRSVTEFPVPKIIEKRDEECFFPFQETDLAPKPPLVEHAVDNKISESSALGLTAQDRVIPVTGMRKLISDRLHQSIQNTAQLTLFAKVDITELNGLRQQLAPVVNEVFSGKLTITDFIARAVVLSLMKHPEMNSALINTEIHLYHHVHLGVAVSLEKGLVVPVIRNAEAVPIRTMSEMLKSLTNRARNGELANEEMQGSTFTITNLGRSGVEYFTPILNSPETGILGIGSAFDEPTYIGEDLKRRSFLPLSLTFDHRVLDGAPAAAFLHSVKDYLEKPLLLLL